MDLLERLGVSPGAAIYVAAVWAIGGLLIAKTAIWLRSAERRRRERVEEKEWFEAVLTDTPLDDPVAEARARGLVNIEGNTTVTRRVLIPTLVVATVVLAVLPFLGQIPAALISIVAAIATVVVGVAARPVVESAFAGLAIAWSRQVNIGDTVLVDDFYGTVEDITVTHTTVRLWDWRRYVVPNAKMMNSSLVNYSLHDRFQWAYVEFWVGPEVDLEVVEELAVMAPERSARTAFGSMPAYSAPTPSSRKISATSGTALASGAAPPVMIRVRATSSGVATDCAAAAESAPATAAFSAGSGAPPLRRLASRLYASYSRNFEASTG